MTVIMRSTTYLAILYANKVIAESITFADVPAGLKIPVAVELIEAGCTNLVPEEYVVKGYASKVINESITFAEVPDDLKTNVAAELIALGYENLVPVEYRPVS